MGELTIGTRGSALALWQTRHVAEALRRRQPEVNLIERIVETDGDRQATDPVAKMQSTGVFVRRLEQALLEGEIDLAVHSLKDMPTEQPEGLVIVAVPERHDPRDALVSEKRWTLDSLPAGTVVGTGSPRRRSQLLHVRPDIEVVPIRGNVDTRFLKLKAGEVGALVLAVAGLERLGIDSAVVRPLQATSCLPAVGQGALALEIREDDDRTRDCVAPLNHEPSYACAVAERSFLRRLGAGCLAPAGALARIVGERMSVEAFVGDPDGGVILMDRESGAVEDAEILGARMAERALVNGADQILRTLRAGDDRNHAGR